MSYDFQREEEVQDYINGLGIEYRFGCYKEKKPAVCHLLGDYFEAIKKEYENSATVYKKNCDDYGYGKSCVKYGNYALIGKGRQSADSTEALHYFEKGCADGDPTGCLHAGILLTKSSGEIKAPKTDIPKGFNYLKKSCDNRMPDACYFLSGMYMNGVSRDTKGPPDANKKNRTDYVINPCMKEAFKYAVKSCELGNIFACANVSMMYKNGDGVDKDEESAKKYRKIAEAMQLSAETTKELKFQQGLDNIGIIGGSGFDDPALLEKQSAREVLTPFGKPSDVLLEGTIKGVPCVLLARHGRKHQFQPSDVNYRANIWALKEAGCTHILATTATGSLREEYKPGDLVVLSDFIDRTWGRPCTFFDNTDGGPRGVCHLPMRPAFCERGRSALVRSARQRGYDFHEEGVCVVIQGPRFSSRAESLMHRQWGGQLVNMTTVPEVVLAKEAGLSYAAVALVTDYDCWRDNEKSELVASSVMLKE